MKTVVWLASVVMLLGPIATWAQSRQLSYDIVVGRDGYKTTPEGIALCIALGVDPGAPCNGDVILEQSRKSTDRSLWIQKTTSGLENSPLDQCLNPILIETYGQRTFVHACHVPDENDTISGADLQRVRDMATKLNANSNKTLSQHQWVMDLKNVWKYGPD